MEGMQGATVNPRILMVDDDPNILSAFGRNLRGRFEIDTALGGVAGVELFERKGPYAVVVSDFQMPGMSGAAFLAAVRERAPETVRIMLTGQADLQAAVDIVNRGNVFRFLTKPCDKETLSTVLEDGLRQYRLIRVEQELLENTLRGAIDVLTEVLALTSPEASPGPPGCATWSRTSFRI
jgi:DNA-binding NtrC family response regulator